MGKIDKCQQVRVVNVQRSESRAPAATSDLRPSSSPLTRAACRVPSLAPRHSACGHGAIGGKRFTARVRTGCGAFIARQPHTGTRGAALLRGPTLERRSTRDGSYQPIVGACVTSARNTANKQKSPNATKTHHALANDHHSPTASDVGLHVRTCNLPQLLPSVTPWPAPCRPPSPQPPDAGALRHTGRSRVRSSVRPGTKMRPLPNDRVNSRVP